jgi:hypothetical protein
MPDEVPLWRRKTLEARIKESLLTLAWKKDAQGASPGYFVSASPHSVRLEPSAASFLARFITEQTCSHSVAAEDEPDDESLNGYSLEIIATYLEDHGYVVSLPD